jgi:transcriptional regulator GlxA family with amidase domain
VHVAIIMYDGVDELDALGPYRVLEGAADVGEDIRVTLCTLEETETVTAAHGLAVRPDTTIHDVEPDLVVVPGGGWNTRSEVGAWAEAEDGRLLEVLRRLHDRGVPLAGVCTGGMLLANTGLTDGRPAVTHQGAIDELAETGADVRAARVVDDGDIVTAGGVTAGIDLALHLIERELGAEVATAVASRLEYDRQDSVATFDS